MPKVKKHKYVVLKPFAHFKRGQKLILKDVGHTKKLMIVGFIKPVKRK